MNKSPAVLDSTRPNLPHRNGLYPSVPNGGGSGDYRADKRSFGVLALWLLTLAALCLSFVSCASPTRPSAPHGPLRLALAGQSNSILLRPELAKVADVSAFHGEVTGIDCWSASAKCWLTLRPQLSRVDAFVWSQGEYDVLLTEMPTATYAQRQADLFARVGALPVVLEMGPMFSGPRGGVLGPQYQAMKRSSGALWIETADLAWSSDEVHMTKDGYRALAARIVARVTERVR